MKTEAKIIVIQNDVSLVAAETLTGDVTVFEMLGCETIALGDIIDGYMDEWGNQTLYNVTRDETFSVYVHEYGCSVESAIERYFTSPQSSATEENLLDSTSPSGS